MNASGGGTAPGGYETAERGWSHINIEYTAIQV